MKLTFRAFIFVASILANLSGCASRSPALSDEQTSMNETANNLGVNLMFLYEREKEAARAQAKALPTPKERDLLVSKIMGANNAAMIESSKSIGSKSTITLADAEKLRALTLTHRIVGDIGTRQYDIDFETGFCFGRAMFVHYELRRLGFTDASIRKVFVIGGLYYQNRGWSFHVATTVKDTNGDWLVIDGLMPQVMKLPQWTSTVQSWDRKPFAPSVRFYLTSPEKFRPLPGAYDEASLNDPMYKGYFKDLLNSFR